jgi:hypothetical protein
MAETITTALNATFALTTSYNLTVTDDQGVGRTVTIGTAATTTYWRIAIAGAASPATPSTTAGSPKRLLDHIAAKLNAGGSDIWLLSVTTSGFVNIAYSGVVRAGTIELGSVPRNLLGFADATPDISVPMGGSQTATHYPSHSAYFLGPANATNWRDTPPLCSISEGRDGSSYSLTDTMGLREYTFDGLYHPTKWSDRTVLGISATASSATPIYGDSSRYKTRSAAAGVTPPWGLTDFMFACLSNGATADMAKCGAVIGTFQSVVGGSVTTFDEVYVSAETLTKSKPQVPSIANWSARMNWPGIVLRQYAEGVSF